MPFVMMAPFSPSLFDFFYLANKLALIDIYVTYTRTLPPSSPLLLLLTTNKKTFSTQMRYLLGAIAQKKAVWKKNRIMNMLHQFKRRKKNIQRQYTLHYEFISYFISFWQNINFILNFFDTYKLIEIKIFISLSSVLDYYIVKLIHLYLTTQKLGFCSIFLINNFD